MDADRLCWDEGNEDSFESEALRREAISTMAVDRLEGRE